MHAIVWVPEDRSSGIWRHFSAPRVFYSTVKPSPDLSAAPPGKGAPQNKPVLLVLPHAAALCPDGFVAVGALCTHHSQMLPGIDRKRLIRECFVLARSYYVAWNRLTGLWREVWGM